VGYSSPYPEDLLQAASSRLLTPKDDTAALAGTIQRLDRNRDELAQAVEHCHRISENYTDKAVFRHRSHLIKQHLQ
jgi:colanic acid/amylovoran biosynthesis glycosyltransferase